LGEEGRKGKNIFKRETASGEGEWWKNAGDCDTPSKGTSLQGII